MVISAAARAAAKIARAAKMKARLTKHQARRVVKTKIKRHVGSIDPKSREVDHAIRGEYSEDIGLRSGFVSSKIANEGAYGDRFPGDLSTTITRRTVRGPSKSGPEALNVDEFGKPKPLGEQEGSIKLTIESSSYGYGPGQKTYKTFPHIKSTDIGKSRSYDEHLKNVIAPWKSKFKGLPIVTQMGPPPDSHYWGKTFSDLTGTVADYKGRPMGEHNLAFHLFSGTHITGENIRKISIRTPDKHKLSYESAVLRWEKEPRRKTHQHGPYTHTSRDSEGREMWTEHRVFNLGSMKRLSYRLKDVKTTGTTKTTKKNLYDLELFITRPRKSKIVQALGLEQSARTGAVISKKKAKTLQNLFSRRFAVVTTRGARQTTVRKDGKLVYKTGDEIEKYFPDINLKPGASSYAEVLEMQKNYRPSKLKTMPKEPWEEYYRKEVVVPLPTKFERAVLVTSAVGGVGLYGVSKAKRRGKTTPRRKKRGKR